MMAPPYVFAVVLRKPWSEMLKLCLALVGEAWEDLANQVVLIKVFNCSTCCN